MARRPSSAEIESELAYPIEWTVSMRLNMFPDFASNDAMGCGNSNAVSFGELRKTDGARSVFCAHIGNLIASECCFMVRDSADNSSVGNLVGVVNLSCTPLKVSNGVVSSIPVWEMPTLHPWRAWPNERLKNNAMDSPLELFAVATERYFEIATPHVSQRELVPFCSQSVAASLARPNTAIAASAITRESRNVSIRNRRIRLRHDVPPRKVRCV